MHKMKQKKQNGDFFSEPEQNGNHLDIGELTLSEEAAFLIQLIFEEFEELLNDYPHHACLLFCLNHPSRGYGRGSFTLRTATRNVALD